MAQKKGLTVKQRQSLEALFRRHGYTDFKWIDPAKVVVSQWVRMKCMFGCREYGQCGTCPPNVPPVAECERFFREYRDAVIFHFVKRSPKPQARSNWARKINKQLLDLEREVFCSGQERAFMLFMDSCNLCKDCAAAREECKLPRMARPTPEGMAVDLYSTLREVGYPIQVLSDYQQEMNRYAFLMVR